MKQHIDFSDYAEELVGSSYEDSYSLAEYFGVSREVAVQLLILKQLQELNRIFYNKLEARQ
jgi:hypothetical protein